MIVLQSQTLKKSGTAIIQGLWGHEGLCYRLIDYEGAGGK